MRGLRFRLRLQVSLWRVMLLVAGVAVALWIEQTWQGWQRFEKQARLYEMAEFKELRELVILDSLIAEQQRLVRDDTDRPGVGARGRARDQASASVHERLADWSQRADETRRRADEFARRKQHLRTRWW